ncbi:putative oleoyl-[acyl-carrier-protein] hydrolase [Helianthus annuus]|nr:putative oleoyl-[acyl-carrier-protein] hydrolase [Helianthus annuus]
MGCVHRFLGLSVGLIQVIKNPLCLIMNLTLSYVFLHSKIYCRGHLVQVDTWVAPNDKNSMRRDWLLCDYKTDDVLTRASRLLPI